MVNIDQEVIVELRKDVARLEIRLATLEDEVAALRSRNMLLGQTPRIDCVGIPGSSVVGKISSTR